MYCFCETDNIFVLCCIGSKVIVTLTQGKMHTFRHSLLLTLCLSLMILSSVSTFENMSAFQLHEVVPDVIDISPAATVHVS